MVIYLEKIDDMVICNMVMFFEIDLNMVIEHIFEILTCIPGHLPRLLPSGSVPLICVLSFYGISLNNLSEKL